MAMASPMIRKEVAEELDRLPRGSMVGMISLGIFEPLTNSDIQQLHVARQILLGSVTPLKPARGPAPFAFVVGRAVCVRQSRGLGLISYEDRLALVTHVALRHMLTWLQSDSSRSTMVEEFRSRWPQHVFTSFMVCSPEMAIDHYDITVQRQVIIVGSRKGVDEMVKHMKTLSQSFSNTFMLAAPSPAVVTVAEHNAAFTRFLKGDTKAWGARVPKEIYEWCIERIARVGMTVDVHAKCQGKVMFAGPTSPDMGFRYGVCLEKNIGFNDGSFQDGTSKKVCFKCKPGYGLFVTPEKIRIVGQSSQPSTSSSRHPITSSSSHPSLSSWQPPLPSRNPITSSSRQPSSRQPSSSSSTTHSSSSVPQSMTLLKGGRQPSVEKVADDSVSNQPKMPSGADSTPHAFHPSSSELAAVVQSDIDRRTKQVKACTKAASQARTQQQQQQFAGNLLQYKLLLDNAKKCLADVKSVFKSGKKNLYLLWLETCYAASGQVVSDRSDMYVQDIGPPIGYGKGKSGEMRCAALRDTLAILAEPYSRMVWHQRAAKSLQKASKSKKGVLLAAIPADTLTKQLMTIDIKTGALSAESKKGLQLQLFEGDWGDVTQMLTFRDGVNYAVLNMANAYTKGGGYWEGMAAQEENMWRRSDCCFEREYTSGRSRAGKYPVGHGLQGGNAEVVTCCSSFPQPDVETAPPKHMLYERSVCIKGSEYHLYQLLEHPFEFYELRSAGFDSRGADYKKVVQSGIYEGDMRTRIHRLVKACSNVRVPANTIPITPDTVTPVRHVVLSAYSCGAFMNDAWKFEEQTKTISLVATLFLEEIRVMRSHFDVVAFAIFNPGYGDDNFSIFRDAWVAIQNQERGNAFDVKDKAPEYLWSWQVDAHKFSNYSPKQNQLLTSGWYNRAEKSKVRISPTHYVDFRTMQQCRFDAPTRCRPVRLICQR